MLYSERNEYSKVFIIINDDDDMENDRRKAFNKEILLHCRGGNVINS